MTVLEGSVAIDRPPEEVFWFVADPRNDPRWCPRVATCAQVEGDGPAAGARFDAFHRPSLQRPHHRMIELLEVTPPRRVHSRQSDNVGVFTITYELEPAGAGTLLRQRDDIAWRIPTVFVPIARRIVAAHIPDQLGRLKELLEREPARAAA